MSTNLVDQTVNEVGFFSVKILEPADVIGFLVLAKHVLKRVAMRTLVIGMVIAIVFLATYLVSTMERVW
jgi:hypothetical protein